MKSRLRTVDALSAEAALPRRPLSPSAGSLRISASAFIRSSGSQVDRFALSPFSPASGNPETRSAASFDHLVGADDEGLRQGEADCARGLQIDRECEFGRLLHRQIARVRALQ